jgi:hypothetical protein
MTRLRVVSCTGATSAVVLLLPEQRWAIEAHVECGRASGEARSNAANSLDTGCPSCHTIHVGGDFSPG